MKNKILSLLATFAIILSPAHAAFVENISVDAAPRLFTANYSATTNGTGNIGIFLNSDKAVNGFRVQFTLPDGFSKQNITFPDPNAHGWELGSAITNGNILTISRIRGLSPASENIPAGNNILLANIEVKAPTTPGIHNLQLSFPNEFAFYVKDPTATKIITANQIINGKFTVIEVSPTATPSETQAAVTNAAQTEAAQIANTIATNQTNGIEGIIPQPTQNNTQIQTETTPPTTTPTAAQTEEIFVDPDAINIKPTSQTTEIQPEIQETTTAATGNKTGSTTNTENTDENALSKKQFDDFVMAIMTANEKATQQNKTQNKTKETIPQETKINDKPKIDKDIKPVAKEEIIVEEKTTEEEKQIEIPEKIEETAKEEIKTLEIPKEIKENIEIKKTEEIIKIKPQTEKTTIFTKIWNLIKKLFGK